MFIAKNMRNHDTSYLIVAYKEEFMSRVSSFIHVDLMPSPKLFKGAIETKKFTKIKLCLLFI